MFHRVNTVFVLIKWIITLKRIIFRTMARQKTACRRFHALDNFIFHFDGPTPLIIMKTIISYKRHRWVRFGHCSNTLLKRCPVKANLEYYFKIVMTDNEWNDRLLIQRSASSRFHFLLQFIWMRFIDFQKVNSTHTMHSYLNFDNFRRICNQEAH